MISIIIPAFNEEAFLAQTLEQIHVALDANKQEGFSWEIIVCDNNSTDHTAEIAASMGAIVVVEPINQIARARNRGAAIAKGEWFLFIDADTFPPPALMADVLEIIERGGYIGCGTTITVEGGTLFNKLRMERLNPLFRLFNWSGGAFLLCEGKAFHAIGGFSLNLYAYEEIDFVLCLKRHGRQSGRRFTVLHRHSVITSGRKGNYRLVSLGTLFLSNVAALLLFGLHYLLPSGFVRKLGARMLGYWYDGRR